MGESESDGTSKKPAYIAPKSGEQSETEQVAKKPAAVSPQAKTAPTVQEHAPKHGRAAHTQSPHIARGRALGITRARTSGCMRKPACEPCSRHGMQDSTWSFGYCRDTQSAWKRKSPKSTPDVVPLFAKEGDPADAEVIARWDDGTTWSVPGVTNAELQATKAQKGKNGDNTHWKGADMDGKAIKVTTVIKNSEEYNVTLWLQRDGKTAFQQVRITCFHSTVDSRASAGPWGCAGVAGARRL
eukprot:7293488-Karenia_brevis.AAC.2